MSWAILASSGLRVERPRLGERALGLLPPPGRRGGARLLEERLQIRLRLQPLLGDGDEPLQLGVGLHLRPVRRGEREQLLELAGRQQLGELRRERRRRGARAQLGGELGDIHRTVGEREQIRELAGEVELRVEPEHEVAAELRLAQAPLGGEVEALPEGARDPLLDLGRKGTVAWVVRLCHR